MSRTIYQNVMVDGPRIAVVNISCQNVIEETRAFTHIIDPSEFDPVPTRFAIRKASYATTGIRLTVYWNPNHDNIAFTGYTYHSTEWVTLDYERHGGLYVRDDELDGRLFVVAEVLDGFGLASEGAVTAPAGYELSLELTKKYD